MSEIDVESGRIGDGSVDNSKPQEETSDFPFRVDWYQTDSCVFITVFKKKTNPDDNYDVSFTDFTAKITVKTEDGKGYEKLFHLEKPIIPDKSKSAIFPSKIEMTLKKLVVGMWERCELKAPVEDKSNRTTKNWDKVASEFEEDKAEGEALLNQFFQDIYSNGSDEVKKAMVKSFTESGGTELSTNWEDVAKDTVTIKPPEGMEWKPWDK